MDPNDPLRFQNLPYDIYLDLAKQLDYQSLINLSSTNRLFHEILNPAAIFTRSEIADLCDAQDRQFRAIGKELFACYKCFRFMPKKKFGRPGSFGHDAWQNRFCLDCSAKLKRYQHGRAVWNATKDMMYYFCHNCCRYQTESTKCQGNRIDKCSGEDEIADALSLCAKPPPRRACHGLEALPMHIMAKISSFLGFDDVLRLTQVSHTLNDLVKPDSWVPLHKRYCFVKDKWTREREDAVEFSDIENFPCYMCFRIRPRRKFPTKQIDLAEEKPETMWKMRCHRCVDLMGCGVKSLTRIEQRRRELCIFCGCIKHARKPCGGCMDLYVRGLLHRKAVYPDDTQMLNGLAWLFDEDDWIRQAAEFRKTIFVWEEYGDWGVLS
ncbi:hypothetical protein ACHAPT_001103 [Fusarium lateritium]